MIAAASLLFAALVSAGTTYEVGPGRTLAELDQVPWESLQAGDAVTIHARPEPYRGKFVLCVRGTKENPIVIRGVRDADGNRPVIDGRDAVTRSQLNYWNEARGVVKIGGANRPADVTPAYVRLEGLEIRGGREPFYFEGRDGRTAYAENAAAVFIEKGEQITLRDCALRDSGNGLFVAPASRDVRVEGCELDGNGNPGSAYEHNAYTSALGMTYEGNAFGPLREGALGNNLKDRSAGLVVRANRIEGGNRQLDLVDAGHGELSAHPSYATTTVVGNLLIEPENAGNNQIVHHGGDSDHYENYRPGGLRFEYNTVVTRRPGITTLLSLSSPKGVATVRGNVFVAPEGGRPVVSTGPGRVELGVNWFARRWQPGAAERVTGGEHVLSGRDPGFVADHFAPAEGSPLVDAGPADVAPPPVRFAVPVGTTLRDDAGRPDLGAFPRGAKSTE
ncbi:polysaccharide-degrading enzyme [Alienimonas sp. DA493]|uniref:polysaccharide-degrading enzyme n=1 Tax=Alienimonas sp. DA493 TaxID=3373605 RepID=UPI0037540064